MREQNEIAILMAAGLGSRMRPLTNTSPKPLITVHGIPMIETVIRALEERGIYHIYVVVGYLGEQFGYLEEKYDNLSIIRNPYYESINNISSIHVVTNKMREYNSFICEADLYIPDPSVLNTDHYRSCYYGKMVRGYSDDWVFDQDETGRIRRIGKGGEDRYNMCGVSFFLQKDSCIIADAIDETWGTEGFEDLFWDEVVNRILDKVDITVHPIKSKEIVEIDTVEELKQVDSSYDD